MKTIKKITICLLCMMLILTNVGCRIPFLSSWKSNAVKEAEAISKVAFGTRELTEDEELFIFSEEDLLEEELEADDYRGNYQFNTLDYQEQVVYHALEYALENGYTYIYVDEKLISRTEKLGEVLERLALDSPLLEQNLFFQTGEFTTYYDVEGSSAELSGCYIKVDNFEKKFWSKKMSAVKEAEELVASLPQNMSEVEIAEHLHRLLLDNIDYYDYSDRADEPVKSYLYDAFFQGKTHCDGSANAYSLLLNIAGIKCMEKQYTGDNTMGHTWNFAFLDGDWYNIDATAVEDRDSIDYDYRVRKLFAFSDEAQQYTPDYASSYPKAENDLGMKINDRISSMVASDFIAKVKKAYRDNGEDYACFIVYNFNENVADTTMRKLANALDSSVYWILYEGKDKANENKAILVIFSE